MLRIFFLMILLGGCASAGVADEVASDLCSLKGSPGSGVVRIRAIVETDGHHGMFLSSTGCRFRLRVARLSENRDGSVDDFISYVSRGQHFKWRKYHAEISGHVIVDASSSARFEILKVHQFQEDDPGAASGYP